MKVYLSGPMHGYVLWNYPLFMATAMEIRQLGNDVYNPAEYEWDHVGKFPKREAFAVYTNYICEHADALVMLPRWRLSIGAVAEWGLARALGIPAIEWPDQAAVLQVTGL